MGHETFPRVIRDGQGFPDDETDHRYWDFSPLELEAVG